MLGRHSGRHGVAYRLEQLGFTFEPDAFESVYEGYIRLADREREITDAMLRELIEARETPDGTAASPAFAQGSSS